MSQQLQSVMQAALKLSSQDRAALAEELLRSLDDPGVSAAEQADIDDAWDKEIGRRIADVKSGRVQLVDGEDFRRRLRTGQRP